MDEVLAKAKRRGIEVIAAPHIGSLSAAGGSEEGPSVRHPALHVLTRDLGDWHRKRESQRHANGCNTLRNRGRAVIRTYFGCMGGRTC
jgi:hypothetical protein